MRLRILSYNIHRGIGVDRRFRIDRIATILEHHDADVVLLQEVDQGVPRSSKLDLARELASALDYPYVAVGHNVQLRTGRYGNATLSRHPIRKHRNIDLTVGRLRSRGCQHTRLVVTDRAVRAADWTHSTSIWAFRRWSAAGRSSASFGPGSSRDWGAGHPA